MPEGLLISIITPCLNRASMIGESIQSVLDQDYPYVEHIIVDGGSTDGTLEVLAKYPNLHVVSQSDEGIYDAINKGVVQARGEVIGFLNTDDYYESNVFSAVIREFSAHPDCEAVVGGAELFRQEADGNRLIIQSFPAITPEQLFFRLTQGVSIFNAWFFRKRIIEEIGAFNDRLRYAADREFLIRFAMLSKKFISLNLTLYHYRAHPGSLTLRDQDNGEAEFMFEDRSIAENYLDQPDLDTKLKRVFQSWHSLTTSDQIIGAFRNKAPLRGIKYIRTGMQKNPSWGFVFIGRCSQRSARWLKKNIRFRRL